MVSEYPKRILVDDPNGQILMDAIYVHERENLGLEKDMFVPHCPVCIARKQ